MIWILILVLSHDGVAVATAEFNTPQACQVAAETMKKKHMYMVDSATCFAKGEKK